METNEKLATNHAETVEQLMLQNISALSALVANLGTTVDLLTQKVESMAYHIIATEEIVAELAADNGLDLAMVNARIRSRIAEGTDNLGDSTKAVDVAAVIASPLPKY